LAESQRSHCHFDISREASKYYLIKEAREPAEMPILFHRKYRKYASISMDTLLPWYTEAADTTSY
jgi:hypothetical protein